MSSLRSFAQWRLLATPVKGLAIRSTLVPPPPPGAHAFHTTLPTPGMRHPKQIKKDNLAKRASRAAALAASKPSPVSSKRTSFLSSLTKPAPPVKDQNLIPGSKGYQHFIKKEEEILVFEQAPRAVADTSPKLGVISREKAEEEEKIKAEMVKKIVGIENANAKAVGVSNVQKAVAWFGRKEGGGDTGSTEVQVAILTVRLQNLYTHLQQHRKDKHNYRQLRIMVHQRARLLKYLKRVDLGRYYKCLSDLGLEQRAVEGEIVL